jgi:hypothetical protein
MLKNFKTLSISTSRKSMVIFGPAEAPFVGLFAAVAGFCTTRVGRASGFVVADEEAGGDEALSLVSTAAFGVALPALGVGAAGGVWAAGSSPPGAAVRPNSAAALQRAVWRVHLR